MARNGEGDGDPFEAAMASMKKKVNALSVNCYEEETGVRASGFATADEMALHLIGQPICWAEVRRLATEGEKRVKRVEACAQLLAKVRAKRVEDIKARIRLFEGKVTTSVVAKKLEKLEYERKLRTQFDTATKRLQELVYECLGEVEKTLNRFDSSLEYSELESREKLAATAQGLKWKLLLERLREDSLGVIETENVSMGNKSGQKMAAEILDDLCLRTDSFGCGNFSPCRIGSVKYQLNNRVAAESSTVKQARQPSATTGRSNSGKKEFEIANFNTEFHGLLTSLYSDVGIRIAARGISFPDSSNGAPALKSSMDSSEMDKKSIQNFHRRIVRGTRKYPLFEKDIYLTCQVLAWLLWPEYGRTPATSLVYFCLEERTALETAREVNSSRTLSDIYLNGVNQDQRDSSAKSLESFACDCNKAGIDEWPDGLNVVRLEGRHRSHYLLDKLTDVRLKEQMQAFPDVVVAHAPKAQEDTNLSVDGTACHFIPATIQNLLETVRFMDLNSQNFSAQDRAVLRDKYGTNIAHNALSNLYVVLPKDPANVSALQGFQQAPVGSANASLEALQVVPLPQNAIDELVGHFLVRSACLDNSSKTLMDLDKKYAVLFSRGPYQGKEKVPKRVQSGKTPTNHSVKSPGRSKSTDSETLRGQDPSNVSEGESNALLVCLSTDLNHTIADDRERTSAKSKEEIVARLCLWRGCNALRCVENSHGLCEYHTYFMDLFGVYDEDEIKRHVPKNGLSSLVDKVDQQAILKSSSLVSELLNKKLTNTVHGFCNRAASAARPKQPKGTNAESKFSPEDRIERAEKRKKSLEVEIDLARKVAIAEREVKKELQWFVQVGVFPSDELMNIRQEYRILNEERESLFASGAGIPDRRKPGGTEDEAQEVGLEVSDDERKLNLLFRSRAAYLDKEYARLVLENESSTGTVENLAIINKSGSSNNSDTVSEREANVSSSVQLRERHLIEAELELEFCLRKLDILREKRQKLNYGTGMIPPGSSGSVGTLRTSSSTSSLSGDNHQSYQELDRLSQQKANILRGNVAPFKDPRPPRRSQKPKPKRFHGNR